MGLIGGPGPCPPPPPFSAPGSTPVTSTQPGVAMVSGFSKNLVKLFLENDGVVSPEAVMAAAISGAEYQKLAVFDW